MSADFAITVTDVSSHRWSKARRLVGTLTLGLIGPRTGAADVDASLKQLDAALEHAGFHVTRLPAVSMTHVLLLRGAEGRLHRELYREQLDVWIQSRSRGEFVFEAPPLSAFTAARRIELLHQPLLDLLPQLDRAALRPDLLAIKAAFPVHDRRFCAQLLSHLCRRPLLQANLLHAIRNEYGEKVAFYFAFRTHQQRWLVVPAAFGTVLWLLRLVAGSLPQLVELVELLTPLYGLGIPVWGTLLLERWRSQQAELASLWGVDDLKEAEVVRAEFVGERVVSRLTGKLAVPIPPLVPTATGPYRHWSLPPPVPTTTGGLSGSKHVTLAPPDRPLSCRLRAGPTRETRVVAYR